MSISNEIIKVCSKMIENLTITNDINENTELSLALSLASKKQELTSMELQLEKLWAKEQNRKYVEDYTEIAKQLDGLPRTKIEGIGYICTLPTPLFSFL